MISDVLTRAAPPVAGAAVAVAVVSLLQETLRPARTCQRYVEDIQVAVAGTARNLELAEDLSRLERALASRTG
jgi:hypothetical protein